jgi:cysteinyl-tRNA synthetase
MSKSLGNVVSIEAMLRNYRPVELRYYLIQPHYRSTIEYSDGALSEAAQGYRRIEQFVRRVAGRTGVVTPGSIAAEFSAAMDDDLATPAAVAAVHNVVREGNAALDAGNDQAARSAAGSVRAMMDVLGLDPLAAQWAETSGADTPARQALTDLVDGLLAERQEARAARDFARADAVRDRLLKAGITVEDTPDGPLWTVKDA